MILLILLLAAITLLASIQFALDLQRRQKGLRAFARYQGRDR